MKRLFLALWPDVTLRESLRKTLTPLLHTLRLKPAMPENWHVTLVFLGALDESVSAALDERLQHLAVEPFRITFDALSHWPKPQVVCLTARTVPPALSTLVQNLSQAASDCGIAIDPRPYRPHVTVARRVRGDIVPPPLPTPVDWSAACFALVQSISGPRGVSYHPLRFYPNPAPTDTSD